MATTSATLAPPDLLGPDEIRPSDFASEIARRGVGGVAVLAAGTALVAVSVWNPVPSQAFWLTVALASVALLGWGALALGPLAVAAVLSGALGAIVIGGATIGGAAWLLPWSSVVV